ncbi:MAG: Lin0512 family protein [Pseudomonadota bacterium]
MSGTSMKRIILEMGTGNDLYGGDYTKAAKRAVQDAIHHSSLTLFKSLEIDPAVMEIELVIAAQEPERVNLNDVAKELPYGRVTAKASFGGLNIPDHENGRNTVIVNAGIVVRLPLRH